MNNDEQLKLIFNLTNKRKSRLVSCLYIVFSVVFLCGALLFILFHQNLLLLFDIVLAIGSFSIFGKINPSFFEMLVTDDELQLNYYTLALVHRDHQSLQFDRNQLKSFKIQKSFMGLRSDLVITIQTPSGLADFPPVSTTLLSRNEISQITQMLNTIIWENRQISRK